MKAYRTALITGASSGIGEAFAKALAAQGLDLILVARSEDRLRALAKQLAEVHARRVEVVTADLSLASAAQKIKTAVDALAMPVDLLVNSAGFGTAGAFHQQAQERERQEILLNAAAVVDLTHAFLPGMLERKSGGIINVASAAAFQPLPFMSVYAATKAFVLSFSHGIRGEYQRQGIKVTALCPGPVDTPFFEATGAEGLRNTVPKRMMVTAERVVSDCLRAFKAGKAVCVPGAATKLMAVAGHMTPRGMLGRITARVMKR